MADRFLIVVDMQNDFIDGALGTPEAQAILTPAAEKIGEARGKGYALIATRDTHSPDYMETSEGQKLPVPHCLKGSDGWQVHPVIREALGEAVTVDKNTFGSIDLPDLIREMADGDPAVIEFMGVCTDICVVSNALILKAHFPEARISVHAGLCAGVTPEKHRAALETMASCQIDVI